MSGTATRLWTRTVLAGALTLAALHAAAAEDVEERWPIALDSGSSVTAVLRRPASTDGPLPTIVLFGGFDDARRILGHIATDRPMIRASFAYPWQAPAALTPWSLPREARAFGQAVDDTFDGIAKLLRDLRARPDVDPTRLVIAGASAGAPFATIAGARGQTPGVIIVQGFGDLDEVIARQFLLELEPRYGGWIRPPVRLFARLLVWWLALPAPEAAAATFQPTQKILMLNAQDDQRIPATATATLWHAIQSSPARATRIDLPGPHLYGYGDPAITTILGRAVLWLESEDLLPAAD